MTLREANEIIQNPKDHWSNEKAEATEYCLKAVKYLVNAADVRGNDDAEIIVDYLDRRIAATDPSRIIASGTRIVVCGNCKNFDPIGNCQCDLGLNRFPQPMEDAAECRYFDPGRKEDI